MEKFDFYFLFFFICFVFIFTCVTTQRCIDLEKRISGQVCTACNRVLD